MKLGRACLLGVMWLSASGSAPAEGKYNPAKICPDANRTPQCDHLLEKAVARDVPGVIERRGAVLRIRAKNGKTIERKNSPHTGEGHKEVWVCDFLPAHGYLRLCYRFWESSGTEYVNIRSGSANFIGGWPTYSPSGQRMLMVNGYAGDVFGVEIWRFEMTRMVREFNMGRPPMQGWETGVWKGEDAIEAVPDHVPGPASHILIRGADGWRMQER